MSGDEMIELHSQFKKMRIRLEAEAQTQDDGHYGRTWQEIRKALIELGNALVTAEQALMNEQMGALYRATQTARRAGK